MSRVSCKERDFLAEDAAIRGQNYVCLSFISPEEVIQNKECYIFQHFMKHLSEDVAKMLDNIKEIHKEDKQTVEMVESIKERHDYLFSSEKMDTQYQFYKSLHQNELDTQYLKENDFQTNIRGIKVRGVYDTILEAQNRAKHLQKTDPHFNIVIGQVGCWCPFSPNPEDIENSEYSETELNSLMKKYDENVIEKELHYKQRREELQKKTGNITLNEKMSADASGSASV